MKSMMRTNRGCCAAIALAVIAVGLAKGDGASSPVGEAVRQAGSHVAGIPTGWRVTAGDTIPAGDCDANGSDDTSEIAMGTALDCNSNGLPDICEWTMLTATSFDDGLPDYAQTNGSAAWVAGAVRLTEAIESQMGSVIFEPPVEDPFQYFSAAFDFRIGGGTGADGFSFALLEAVTYDESTVFGEPGPGGGSIAFKFDTFANEEDLNDNHIAVYRNGGLVETYTPTFDLDDDVWHHVEIEFFYSHLRMVVVGGNGLPETVFDTPFAPRRTRVNRYGFGGRTGAATNEHWIDEVRFSVIVPAEDCNQNGVLDECDLAGGTSMDCDRNTVPDECEPYTPADIDGDGVDNCADLCPFTPAGEAANADGCSCSQLDDDDDGVDNCSDLCPNTAAGVAVDATGCAAGGCGAMGLISLGVALVGLVALRLGRR
jgi:hypothetical protein